eukprot:IDg16065t1
MASLRRNPRKVLRHQKAHEKKFGLRRSPAQSAKRKATGRCKYFNTFRTDHYMQHLLQKHPEKWSVYAGIDCEQDKEAFLSTVEVPFANTLDAHFERSGTVRFLINARIVEVIIGDLLFDPNDVEGLSRSRALSLFKLVEPDDGARNSSGDDNDNDVPVSSLILREEYMVEIKTAKRFHLLVDAVSLGASFRMGARMVQMFREHYHIRQSAQLKSVDILPRRRLEQPSIALLPRIRARITVNSSIYNLHLLALPLFERHTGEYMFETTCKFLDALYPQWKETLLAVSSDGARSMTGRVQGFLTRIGAVAAPGMMRVWCGLHQLYIVLQSVYNKALDEEFLSTFISLIGHLRRQQNLIQEMLSTCPKFATTRWVSMHSCSRWLTKNVVRVCEHLKEKAPRCAPAMVWWTFLFAVHAFADEARRVFVKLQGHTTLLAEQRALLLGLVDTHCRTTGMTGPHDEVDTAAMDSTILEVHGGFALTHSRCKLFIESQGIWVVDAIDELEAEDLQHVVASVARLFVEAASRITQIVAVRDASNLASTNELPPVLPHQIIALDMRVIVNCVNRHRERLLCRFS